MAKRNIANEKDLFAFRTREPSSESELENLIKLSKVHPLGALLSAISYLEHIVIEFGKKNRLENFERKLFMGGVSHRSLMRYGVIPPDELQRKMDEARQIRNLALFAGS